MRTRLKYSRKYNENTICARSNYVHILGYRVSTFVHLSTNVHFLTKNILNITTKLYDEYTRSRYKTEFQFEQHHIKPLEVPRI